MDKNKIAAAAALVLSAVLIVLVLVNRNFSSEYVSFAVTFCVIIAGYSIYRAVKKNRVAVEHDEMTVMVSLKSIRNSWVCAYLTISAISLIHFFGLFHFTLELIVFYLVISMNLSLFASMAFYRNRPDSL